MTPTIENKRPASAGNFPAEHFGAMEKRKWYKIRWISSPEGETGLAWKKDLLPEETIDNYRKHAEVIEEIMTKKCISGLSIDFGKLSENEIDDWIAKNRL